MADGEHYFVSGSKDRTAKVWSVRNQGSGSTMVNCSLTYAGHQKPVIAIELMENMDSVVSCDGYVHVSVCVHVCVCMCACMCTCVCVHVCMLFEP